jgi:hypothetical protein
MKSSDIVRQAIVDIRKVALPIFEQALSKMILMETADPCFELPQDQIFSLAVYADSHYNDEGYNTCVTFKHKGVHLDDFCWAKPNFWDLLGDNVYKLKRIDVDPTQQTVKFYWSN